MDWSVHQRYSSLRKSFSKAQRKREKKKTPAPTRPLLKTPENFFYDPSKRKSNPLPGTPPARSFFQDNCKQVRHGTPKEERDMGEW